MLRYEVKRGINLTMSIQDKRELSSNSEGILFLVNNAHSIVHVVFSWSETGNFRDRLPKWLKGTHNRYLENYFCNKYAWLLEMNQSLELKPEVPVEEDFTSDRRFKSWRKSQLRIIK